MPALKFSVSSNCWRDCRGWVRVRRGARRREDDTGHARALAAIDRDRYDVVAVGITREGRWVLADSDPQRYRLVEGVLPQVDSSWPVVAVELSGGGALLHAADVALYADKRLRRGESV